MQAIHSMRCRPTRSIRHTPVVIHEEVSFSPEKSIEPVWDDMLRAMARRRGCMSLECERMPTGYCLRSCWTSLQDFTNWTQATIFMVVAAEIDSRQVAVRPLTRDAVAEEVRRISYSANSH